MKELNFTNYVKSGALSILATCCLLFLSVSLSAQTITNVTVAGTQAPCAVPAPTRANVTITANLAGFQPADNLTVIATVDGLPPFAMLVNAANTQAVRTVPILTPGTFTLTTNVFLNGQLVLTAINNRTVTTTIAPPQNVNFQAGGNRPGVIRRTMANCTARDGSFTLRNPLRMANNCSSITYRVTGPNGTNRIFTRPAAGTLTLVPNLGVGTYNVAWSVNGCDMGAATPSCFNVLNTRGAFNVIVEANRAGFPILVIGDDETVTVPACQNTVQTSYFFTVTDRCENVDINRITVTNDGGATGLILGSLVQVDDNGFSKTFRLNGPVGATGGLRISYDPTPLMVNSGDEIVIRPDITVVQTPDPVPSITSAEETLTLAACTPTANVFYEFTVDGGCNRPGAVTVNGINANVQNAFGNVVTFIVNLGPLPAGFLPLNIATDVGVAAVSGVNVLPSVDPQPAIIAGDDNVTIPECNGGAVAATYAFAVDGGCAPPAGATVNGVAATPNGPAQGNVQNYFINLPNIVQGPNILNIASGNLALAANIRGILDLDPVPAILAVDENITIPACDPNIMGAGYSFFIDGGCNPPALPAVTFNGNNIVPALGALQGNVQEYFLVGLTINPGVNQISINNTVFPVINGLQGPPPPVQIIADVENVQIPACAQTVPVTYSFNVDGGCAPVNAATINGAPAILIGTNGNITTFVGNGVVPVGGTRLNLAAGGAQVQVGIVATKEPDPIPAIIAANDNVTIPVCDQAVNVTYAFSVDGGCAAPAGATVNGIAATANGAPQGNLQNFTVNIPALAAGPNALAIRSGALALNTTFQVNQQQNLGPQIIFPDEVEYQIPVCDVDGLMDQVITNVQAVDDCDGSVIPTVGVITGPAGPVVPSANVGANGTRTLTFTNLAPGTYTIAVTAQDVDGNNATNPGTVTFRVLAPITPIMTEFSCSKDQGITMKADCATTIRPSQLLVGNSLCPHIENAIRMTAHLTEKHHRKVANNPLDEADANGMAQRTGTGSIVVSTPGKYTYTLELGTKGQPGYQECWGTFILEDKTAPVCMPAGDANAPLTVCGVPNTPRPSGVDDRATEYVSITVVDKNGKDAIEPWFDKLEIKDDPTTAIVEVSDFKDCSDLANLEYTTTKTSYCGDYPANGPLAAGVEPGWEICFVFERTWTAYDWKGAASAPCSQFVVVIRPNTLVDPVAKIAGECEVNVLTPKGPTFTDLAARADGRLRTCPGDAGKTVEIKNGETIGKWTAVLTPGVTLELCSDEGKDCSKASKKYYTWTVLDVCDHTSKKETEQVLVSEDKTAPTLTPGTISVWNNPFDCTTSMTGSFTATDKCSDVVGTSISATYNEVDAWGKVTRTVKEDANGTTLTLSNVPLHRVVTFTYTAWDCCGNSSSTTRTQTSKDNSAPVCVANDELEIGLIITDHNGVHSVGARVYPEDLDDTSKDNCRELKYEIRKVNNGVPGPWGPHVEYSYTKDADFNGPKCIDTQWVDLKVTEINKDGTDGLSTVCASKLILRDNNAPRVISTPAAKTQDCFVHDITFGTPNVWGFCVTPSMDTDTMTYHCPTTVEGVAKVIAKYKRTWTYTKMTEHDMFSTSTSQTIYVTEKRDETFTFPYDFKDECTTTFPAASSLASILDNKGCSEWVMNDVKDEKFAGDDGACYKILRTYDFINWCLWDGSSQGQYVNKGLAANDVNQDDKLLAADGDKQVVIKTGNALVESGRFKYLQIIKIIDNSDPMGEVAGVDGCEPTTAGCNQGTVDFTITYRDVCSTASITDWYINTAANGKAGFTATAQPDAANGDKVVKVSNTGLAKGTYTLHVRLDDECGNFKWISGSATVDESDCKKPTIINAVLVTKVMPEVEPKSVDVWLSDVLVSFSDNCEGPFTFAIENTRTASAAFPTTGTTTDPKGSISATFSCPDDVASGSVRVWMRDAHGNVQYVDSPVAILGSCSGAEAAAEVAGNITNESDDMIDDVMIEAKGTGFNPFANLFDGAFNLYVPMSTDVTVTPTKDLGHMNGVSGADLVALQRHILGIKPLTSAYQTIAADVTADEKVNTKDMLHLSRLILGIYDELPNVDSWRFIDKSHTFASPTSPWGFPESVNYNNLSSNAQADFIGVKMGDLTGNAIATKLLGSDNTKVGEMTMAINDASIKAGQSHTIEFTAKDFNDFTGYQMSIELANGVEFESANVGVLPNHSEGNFGLNRLANRVITTNWANADAVNLEDGAVLFSLTVNVAADMNVSEAIKISSTVTAAEAYNSDLESFGINAQFNRTDASFALYQNTPNPFSAETQIGFQLDKAGAASLKIMDVSGRVLKQVNGTYTAGYHQITLNKSELGATGVLYYQLDTNTNSATKKMVILE